MIDNDTKGNKNLWKSIKTQKAKYSVTDNYHNSPYNYSKQSSLNSQPLRSLNPISNSLAANYNQNTLENQFSQVSKEQQCEQYNLESNEIEHEQLKKSQSQNSSKFTPLSIEYSKKQGRNRKLSMGQESVVEEIVDVKNVRNLELMDFEEDQQQPLMMSLGSQHNPIIKQLKLIQMRSEVQKMRNIQIDLSDYIRQQSKHYKELFETNINTIIAYILDFYSNKFEEDHQELMEEKKDFYNENEIPQIRQSKRQKSEQQTPKFPPKVLYEKLDKSQYKNSKLQKEIQQKMHQIMKLQQQLFKLKSENGDLIQTVQTLKQENEQMNELIFDYNQKIAQIQLEINKKVKEAVDRQVKQKKANSNNDQYENLRREYMTQILQLQQQIIILEKKTKNHELSALREQELIEKQEKLRNKQRELREKELHLNEFQIDIDSQKMEIELKFQKIRLKQMQIQQQLTVLEQKQYQLNVRENQLRAREKDKERQIQRQKERERNHQVYTSNNSFQRSKYENPRKINGDKYTPDNYEIDYETKLKSLFDLKRNMPSKTFLQLQQREYNGKNPYPLSDPNRWKYSNLNQINSIRIKDNELSSQKSHSGSKQKVNHSKTYVSGISLNRNIFAKSSANPASSRIIGHKGNDKSKLNELWSKLENLREQIHRQIRDTS